MKKILITGASGFIGPHLAREAGKRGYEVLAPSHGEFPLESRAAVQKFFADTKPEAVLHLAASVIASGNWLQIYRIQFHRSHCALHYGTRTHQKILS